MLTKFIGWDLIKTKNNKFSIFYEPNIIDEFGAMIYISEEIYLEAFKGELGLKELFEKYNLYNSEKILRGKREIVKLKKNTPKKYYGGGFIATEEEGKYFFKYILARHGGGSRKIPISKEAYLDARTGNYGTSDLFKKYNLYHLDTLEYDVK